MSATIQTTSVDRTGNATGVTITPATDRDGGGSMGIQDGDLLVLHLAAASGSPGSLHAGNTTADDSGNDRTGLVFGAPQVVDSPWSGFGSALDFDGVKDVIDCGPVGTGLSGPFCIEAKFRPDAVPAGANISLLARWGVATANQNYALQMVTPSGAASIVVMDNTGTAKRATGTTVLVAGTPYDIAADYDGTTLRLFLDGVLEGSIAVGGLQAPDATTPLLVADLDREFHQRFAGVLDEVRISDISRHAADYTPSSVPLSPDANTRVLLHLDEVEGGWELVKHNSIDGGVAVTHAVFQKTAGSEPASYSFGYSSRLATDGLTAKLLRIAAQHAASPIDVSAASTGTSGSATFAMPTPTATVDDALVLRFGAFADPAATTVSGVDNELYDFSSDPGNAVSIAAGKAVVDAGAVPADPWTLGAGTGVDSRSAIVVVIAPEVLATHLRPGRVRFVAQALGELTIGSVEDDFPDDPDGVDPPEPLTFVKRMIRTAPSVAPFLGADGAVDVQGWTEAFPQPVYADWGRLRVKIGGRWSTFYRGVPVEVLSWDNAEPFGHGPAQIRLSQINPFEQLPDHITDGCNIEIYLEQPDGDLVELWAGMWVMSDDSITETDSAVILDLIGALYQLDFMKRRPRLVQRLQNIGHLLAYVVGRRGRDQNWLRFRSLNRLTLSGEHMQIINYGDWSDTLTGWVADLLARMWLEDGSSQYTIHCDAGRKAVLRLKDRTTQHLSVHVGEPGVVCSLRRDLKLETTTVFGEGITPDGCRFRNSKYPNILDNPPAPVFSGVPVSPGDTSAEFETFEREMVNRGWAGFEIDGFYDPSESTLVKAFQRDAGVTDDGILDAQTWAAAFLGDTTDGVGLHESYIHSLFSLREVESWNYSPDGGRTTRNGLYDRSRLRVERYVNYGGNVDKREGIISARQEVERDSEPGYFGTITLTADPPEMSRFEIRGGMNILVRGHRGADRLMHIADVQVDWPGRSVSLIVDEKARDVMTLASMMQDERETSDRARRPNIRYRNSSRKTEDTRIQWDCEGGSGIIPYHAITAGPTGWSIIRVPSAQQGRAVRCRIECDVVTRMAVGIFDRPVTANQLRLGSGESVGDPLFYADYWDAFPAPDDNPAGLPGPEGLIIGWGDFEEPAGFHPGRESEGNPVTGIHQDDASWEFHVGIYSPWLWVALYVETGDGGFHAGTNWIQGRIYQANDSV